MLFAAYVYGIRFVKDGHPHSGLIRYVGKSVNPSRRFKAHKKDGHGRFRISLQKHGGDAFSIEILASVSAESAEEADRRALAEEVRLIAAYDTAHGPHGLNLTEGGEGARLVGDALERQRTRSRAHLAEVKKRPEVIARCRELRRAMFDDPIFLAKWRTFCQARSADPSYRAKLKDASVAKAASDPVFAEGRSQRLRDLSRDPGFKQKKAAAIKISNRDPENIAKRTPRMRETCRSSLHRARQAETARQLHQDSQFSERFSAGLRSKYLDPVYAAQHAEQTRRRHDDPSFGRSAKMGIALHWAVTHLANGNVPAAKRQREKLRALLSECGPDEISHIKSQAEQYLEGAM